MTEAVVGSFVTELDVAGTTSVKVGSVVGEVPVFAASVAHAGGLVGEVIRTHASLTVIGAMVGEVLYVPPTPIAPPPSVVVPPDWDQGVTETFEWMTDVFVSKFGHEQRRQLRLSPRRYLEISYTVFNQDRASFDLFMRAYGGSTFYLPDWQDGGKLLEAAPAGITTLYVKTVNTRFAEGYAFIRGRTALAGELVGVQTVGSGTLGLTNPTGLSWGAGARVYPIVSARVDTQPTYSRQGSRAFKATVKYLVQGTQYYTPATTFNSYRGAIMLETRPDESQDISTAVTRMVEILDGDTGATIQIDTAGTQFSAQINTWVLFGRAQYWALVDLLYTLCGQRVPVWVPSFAQDLVPAENIVSSNGYIDVNPIGMAIFGPFEGRQDIYMLMRDGTKFQARITSVSVPSGSALERLFLDTAPPTVAASQVKFISFMVYSRLAQDSIDILHRSDMAGGATVAITFQSTRDET
jgi:hypothetical protein